MLLDITYTIPEGGNKKPLNIIRNDGISLTEAVAWIGSLGLTFSSIKDIDKTIAQLHRLRKEVIEHINKTGCHFIPKVYQNNEEPTVDVLIYEPDKMKVTVEEDENKDLDIITLQYGGEHEDLAHEKISIHVPHGSAKRLGLKIITSAIKKEGTITLEEYENRKGRQD